MLHGDYKALAGVIAALYFAAIFIVTKTFPGLLALSQPATYWFFAAVCLLSNIFYFNFMPETKGKTASEIRQMFLKNVNTLNKV